MIAFGVRDLWLAGSALALLLSAAPASAQEAEECAQRLDQMEGQVADANLESQRQTDIQQVIEGARTLSETGDGDGCMRVLAELEDLMATLEESGSLQDGKSGQQSGQAGPEQGQQQSEAGGRQDQEEPQAGEDGEEDEPQAGSEQPTPTAKEQIDTEGEETEDGTGGQDQ